MLDKIAQNQLCRFGHHKALKEDEKQERRKITLKIHEYKGRICMSTILDTRMLNGQFPAKPHYLVTSLLRI